jgi:uncharacterized protein
MNAPVYPPSADGRIEVIDVLRAFALFGIIVTHSVDGFLAGQPPSPDFMLLSPLDRAVAQAEHLLSFGKFYTIFSFLFGLSFAIQLTNAAQKGVAFAGRFAWRLAVLGLIGLAHGAFFAGDILIIYALLGLLLIPFRNRSSRTLLVWGLILVLNVPGLLLGAALLAMPAPTPEQLAANAAMQEQFRQLSLAAVAAKQSGTLSELAAMNLTLGLLGKAAFMVFTGRLWITFGLFLLGMWAGRLAVFRDTEAHRAAFGRLLKIALPIAVVTTLVEWRYPVGEQMKTLSDLLRFYSFSLQQVSLSSAYVAIVVLLYWRNPARGLLPALAPAGRMGLTTYLSQTVFGVVVFYGLGFGLLGKIGAAAAVGAAVAFFIVQILLAHAWSRHFRIGPVEWLWRTLTYLRVQPLRRAATPGA